MKRIFFLSLLLLSLGACKQGLFYSVPQQKQLGIQVRDEILNLPAEYPVLKEAQYPEAYGHIRRITNTILNSGKIKHRNDFDWEVYIIHDDKTLNAFCTPGGYIFVYTGLIKYLDTEDQLAGVMGHEIAHADMEHSARQMDKQFGTSLLAELLLGNSSEQTKQVLVGFASLSYSRSHETEADLNSVVYLSGTQYQCSGAAGFFEKIVAEGGGGQPAFLSTHPDPGNRVEKIQGKAKEIGCNTQPAGGSSYQAFKNSLPR